MLHRAKKACGAVLFTLGKWYAKKEIRTFLTSIPHCFWEIRD